MGKVLGMSDAASLGLHAMVWLIGTSDGAISAGVIASGLGVSEAHLQKVLHELVRNGLLDSVRGPSGGFSLAKEPEEITLMNIYETVDGPFDTGTCMFSVPVCDGTSCFLGKLSKDIAKEVRGKLEATTVSSLTNLGKTLHEKAEERS